LLETDHGLVENHGLSLTPNQFDVIWREPYSGSIMDIDIVLEGLRTKYRLLLLSNVDAYYWSTVCS